MHEAKQIQDLSNGTRSAMIILMAIVALAIFAQYASALLFNIQTTICDPAWYCTNLSQGSCGIRDCVDANACNTNFNEPALSVACPTPPGSGGGGGGGGNSQLAGTNPQSYPSGYFTTSSSSIAINTFEGGTSNNTLSIVSYDSETYNITIQFPQGYNQSNKLLYTDSGSISTIAGKVQDIIFHSDSNGVTPGTYIVTINIHNDAYSKTITTVITVNTAARPNIDFTVYVDNNLRTSNGTIYLDTTINLISQNSAGAFFEYTIVGPKGNIVGVSNISVDKDIALIKKSIGLPQSLESGYYTLVATGHINAQSTSKSVQFTILSDKYHLIEQPTSIGLPQLSQMLPYLIAIIGIGLLIIGALMIKRAADGEYYAQVAENIRTWSLKKGSRQSRLHSRDAAEVFTRLYDSGFIDRNEYEGLSGRSSARPESKKIERKEGNRGNTKTNNIGQQEKQESKSYSLDIQKNITAGKDNAQKLADKRSRSEAADNIVDNRPTAMPDNTIKIVEQESKDLRGKKKETLEINSQKYKDQKQDNANKKPDAARTLLFKRRMPAEKAFYVHDGTALYSLEEFKIYVDNNAGAANAYAYHTVGGRNDFSSWIEGVFDARDLANSIRGAGSIESLRNILKEYFD